MNGNQIAVVSSLYGDSDPIRQLPDGMPVACYLITDMSRERAAEATEKGWHVLRRAPQHKDPRIASRVPKLSPWHFLPFSRWYVWIDMSIELLDPDYPFAVVANAGPVISAPAHPDRDCLYDEAEASELWPKYAGARTLAATYRRRYMPDHWGLWAMTTLVWENRPLSWQIGERVLRSCRECSNDQISLPFHCWQARTRPTTLPLELKGNGYLKWHPHDS